MFWYRESETTFKFYALLSSSCKYSRPGIQTLLQPMTEPVSYQDRDQEIWHCHISFVCKGPNAEQQKSSSDDLEQSRAQLESRFTSENR